MRSFLASGCLVRQNNKILLVHPKNASWWGTYSIPKGMVKRGESPWDAALRETFEETGLKLDKKETFCAGQIQYNKSKKSLMYFMAELKVMPKWEFIENDEVDWAGFLTREEAEKRILPEQRLFLQYLNMETKSNLVPAPLIEVERNKRATQLGTQTLEEDVNDFIIPKLREFGFSGRLVTADIVDQKLVRKKAEKFSEVPPREMLLAKSAGYFLEIWETGRKYPRLPVKPALIVNVDELKNHPRFNLSKSIMQEFMPTAMPEAKIKAIHNKMEILDLHFLVMTKTGQFWLGKYSDIPYTEYYLTWRKKVEGEKVFDRIARKAGSEIGQFHSTKKYLSESLKEVIYNFNENNVYESK